MPPPAETFASRLFLGPALRTQPDRRLVTLVREGYESAFEEIVRRYGKPLTRYAAAIVGSRGEDVAQDALSKALLALRRNDAEIELRPWLFRIVRNTALNDLRDSPPTPELLAEAIAGGESPAEEMERREELADLMHRLRSLPETQRAAIVMREMEGLSHEEIAAALGVSGGAARQAIHRARRALRNGAGMLVPLPLLKALLAAGTMGTAEVAAAGTGGAVGAGVALKAVTATVLVAGAVGAGVAVQDGRHAGDRPRQPTAFESVSEDQASSPAAFAAPAPVSGDDRSGRERGDDQGHGTSESGDDRGQGENKRGNDGGRRGESGDDHGEGGPGPGGDHGGDAESADDHSGRGGSDSGGGSGHSGSSHGESSSGHGESSGHGGGPGSSEPSGGGAVGDDPASDPSGGSGGGPGPSGPQDLAETSGGNGGPGPSDGSGSDGTSGSGDDLSGGG